MVGGGWVVYYITGGRRGEEEEGGCHVLSFFLFFSVSNIGQENLKVWGVYFLFLGGKA